jgi:hypothetical protein
LVLLDGQNYVIYSINGGKAKKNTAPLLIE